MSSGAVVQAEIEVGLRRVLPSSPATTEQHCDHTVHLAQPLPQRPQLLVIDHPDIMPDQPALTRCRGSRRVGQ